MLVVFAVLHLPWCSQNFKNNNRFYVEKREKNSIVYVYGFISPVAKRGKVVNMTTSYNHVIAYVSQRVTLRCKGVNVLEKYTTIFWERNGSRLEVSNDSYRFPNRKEVVFWYTLRSVTVEDAGNYTCVLVTDRGNIERSIKLCVKKNGK